MVAAGRTDAGRRIICLAVLVALLGWSRGAYDGRKNCPPYRYQCANGRCIFETYVCNGYDDCLDHSDEKHCGSSKCPSHWLVCANKRGKPCLPINWRCDGEADCLDGSDELDCVDSGTDSSNSTVPLLRESSPDMREMVDRVVRKAKEMVGTGIEMTRQRDATQRRMGTATPRDLLRAFRRPNRDLTPLSRAADVMTSAMDMLMEEARKRGMVASGEQNYMQVLPKLLPGPTLKNMSRMAGCLQTPTPTCPRHLGQCICYQVPCACQRYEYRTIDGSCNNLAHPLWGSSISEFKRLLPAIYENGLHAPIGWLNVPYNGYLLPSPRLVSTELITTMKITEDEEYTHMLMQWGQFIDHDLDFTPQVESSRGYSGGDECDNDCDHYYPCFPIPVPRGDERLGGHVRCLGFTRSASICDTWASSLKPREQVNQVTSYMDGSMVYGSSLAELNLLRDEHDRRFLKTGKQVAPGKFLLPYDDSETVECRINLRNPSKVPCFLAGDFRANEHVALTTMHVIWLREHNRVARALSDLNPYWDPETVFQEARKIVIAELAHITYSAWLPKVLGKVGMDLIGKYKDYNSAVDASVSNEFATALFRMGHTMIRPRILRYDENFDVIKQGHLDLRQAFFAPNRIVDEGGIDPIIRGLFGTYNKRNTGQEFLNDELTESLFKLSDQVALDLAALNIQRGRDHGLQFYNDYRKKCGLTSAKTFSDLSKEIKDARVRATLKDLYKHPGNIDLWVGLIAETTAEDARVGPTLQCLLAEQFKRTRDGDRFWYESRGVFQPHQLAELRKTTLARVICDNSDGIERVQADIYSAVRPYVSCGSLPKVDLGAWESCTYHPFCFDEFHP